MTGKRKRVWQVCTTDLILPKAQATGGVGSDREPATLQISFSALLLHLQHCAGSAVSTSMEETLPSYSMPAVSSGCPVIGAQGIQQSLPAGAFHDEPMSTYSCPNVQNESSR